MDINHDDPLLGQAVPAAHGYDSSFSEPGESFCEVPPPPPFEHDVPAAVDLSHSYPPGYANPGAIDSFSSVQGTTFHDLIGSEPASFPVQHDFLPSEGEISPHGQSMASEPKSAFESSAYVGPQSGFGEDYGSFSHQVSIDIPGEVTEFAHFEVSSPIVSEAPFTDTTFHSGTDFSHPGSGLDPHPFPASMPEIPAFLPLHEHYSPSTASHEPSAEHHQGATRLEALKESVDHFIHAAEASFHVFLDELHKGPDLHPQFDSSGWPPSQHGHWSEGNGHVVGTPTSDMSHWEFQNRPDTCAVVSQKFVIEELTGHHVSQGEIVQKAEQMGLYHPGQGTTVEDIGKLLETYGLHTHTEHRANLSKLEETLSHGEKVLVAVRAEAIWESGTPDSQFLHLAQAFGLPGGGADHCVQVIGIDKDHEGGPMVILNDPGTPEGQGLMVPLHDFEAAWSASGNFMVNTLEATS